MSKADTNRPINHDVLEYRAGNRALWTASQKYLGALCAAILAIILTDPPLARHSMLFGLSMNRVIEGYLIVGILGIFFGELRLAVAVELKSEAVVTPIWIMKIVSVYTMLGLLILSQLLHQILTK